MSDSSSDSGDYDSSSDSSSSDDEVVLHKPVFLKRNRKEVQEPAAKKAKPGEQSSHEQLLKRVEFEANAVAKKESTSALIDRDYTTDKELLRRTMALDDNDTVDPEFERKQWQEREKKRQERHREKLVRLQRDLEDREARKLLEPQTTRDLAPETSDSPNATTATPQRKHPQHNKHNSDDSRPQRVQDEKFGAHIAASNPSPDPETEYSVI